MKAYHQITPLIAAAMDNRPEIIKLLIRYGADFSKTDNRYFRPPLIWAIVQEHPETVTALLECGADVHCWDRDGKTALEYAQDLPQIRELLEERSSANA